MLESTHYGGVVGLFKAVRRPGHALGLPRATVAVSTDDDNHVCESLLGDCVRESDGDHSALLDICGTRSEFFDCMGISVNLKCIQYQDPLLF